MALPGDEACVPSGDPTAPQTGLDLAHAVATGQVTVAGHRLHAADLSVELVGSGESYAAWLVRSGAQAVLFRFPRRTPQEMPAAMAEEFAALQQVPVGLGTRGIAMADTTENALGRRYLVTTYVPGLVIDGAAWTEGMLDSCTDQLAVLHDATAPTPDPRPPAPRDLAVELAAGYASWCSDVSPVAATSSAGELVPAAVEYLRRRQWAFEHVTGRVLVHGDAVAANVVFDEHATARFIDWEWAHVGDVAQDLAYVGGQVYGGPWYVPMSAQQVQAQVQRYLHRRRSAGASSEAFQALLARRQSWEVYERFMSSLHFERVHRSSPVNQRYGPWVVTLRGTLADLLGRGEAASG